MADAFENFVLFFLSEECYDKFFVELDFLDVPCLKAAISKVLGLSIIAGSVMVKVPQITKIINGKSAAGISILSVLLDLFAITSGACYSYVKGFPFSAWGESLFLALQTSAIAVLVLLFGGSVVLAVGFLVSYFVLLFVLLSGLTPVDVLWSLQGVNLPIIITGKMIQVIANYRNGGTGQLSAATGFMLFFGSLARIFTSVQETGDTMLILTYLSAFSVNALIAAQLIYYWNVPARAAVAPTAAKPKGKAPRRKEE